MIIPAGSWSLVKDLGEFDFFSLFFSFQVQRGSDKMAFLNSKKIADDELSNLDITNLGYMN